MGWKTSTKSFRMQCTSQTQIFDQCLSMLNVYAWRGWRNKHQKALSPQVYLIKRPERFWDNRLFRGTLGHAVLPVMGAPITICVVKLNLGSRKNTKDSWGDIPEWPPFSPHEVIATSQRKCCDRRDVIVHAPEELQTTKESNFWKLFFF